MRPVIYSANETDYTSNGLGRLSDAIRCVVTEELNGAYELELRYPANGLHAAEVAEGCQILVTHDETGDKQPFRIYKKTDTIDGIFTAFARHISGDLSRIPVMPFTASGVSAALAGLSSHAAVSCPFFFETDMTATGSFTLEVPASAKAALGSGSGSIIGVFGGEVEYDRRTVRLLARRGADTGVSIRYGKNMTGLEVVSEGSAAYNAVVPFCKTQEGVITCSPPVVYHGTSYADAVPLDMSDAFDYVPSQAQLETAALAWLNEHQPWITEKSINVSFIQLRQTTEYADFAPLERVALGDGVTLRYAELGLDADFRVVRTAWDVLEDRYTELTVGREQTTVATMMTEMIKKLEEARNIAQEIANGTYTGGTFINGSLIYAPSIYGGEIAIGQRSGGGYNFTVDSDGNVVSQGSMHLIGPDTRIVAPEIFADSFTVLPQALASDDAPEAEAGFHLYAMYEGRPYHFLKIAYSPNPFPMIRLYSPGGGRIYIGEGGMAPSSVSYDGYHDFSVATVTGLENSGYVKDTDLVNFVTAAEVQQMIDDAIGGTT